ncbi:beta-L-arabinofuranosidase domain-containing protein [Paenibacillus sp. 1P07SE]|uniref:beta-L-arabinofuranosidase domain-containing protein n=1 Tax=Paenibacillus sp. 1P07SE TaxID=3132209 RepID=UPI0039A4D71B
MIRAKDGTVRNAVEPVPLGAWSFGGFLGERIDSMSEARLRSERAWQEIYPETEEAFRLREDDRSHPGRGVWRGEFWGKYVLSAIACCRYYGDDQLKTRISHAVAGLLATQDESGYIGTYSDSAFVGERTWNVWGRKYTLWALMEAWELIGEERILRAACRMADHLIREVGPGGTSIGRTGQFYGMPSTSILKPLLLLYRATSKTQYLTFAEYVVDQWSRHPEGIPDLVNKGAGGAPVHTWFPRPEEWAKSYELVSCVEGLLELYRVCGNELYFQAARGIFDAIAAWERSPVGSISFNDKFVGSRFLINAVAELCDVVYWNRLAFDLFLLTKGTRFIDELELSLYNAMLCGLKTDGSWALRRLRVSHRHIPAHPHFLKHHQCCVDNMPRGLFQAAESAMYFDETGIWVALYNEGHGRISLPSSPNIELAIRGDFLDDGVVRIAVDPQAPVRFALRLRRPRWSPDMELQVNGAWVPSSSEEGWIVVEREWSSGDIVVIRFDVSVRIERFDSSQYTADDPLVVWHNSVWASMGYIGEDGVETGYEAGLPLSVEDALPHQTAVMLFRGPVALARDARLGGPPLSHPLPIDGRGEGVTLQRVEDTEGIWKTFELEASSGEKMRLCDFASAGNTWSDDSRFTAWHFMQESSCGEDEADDGEDV